VAGELTEVVFDDGVEHRNASPPASLGSRSAQCDVVNEHEQPTSACTSARRRCRRWPTPTSTDAGRSGRFVEDSAVWTNPGGTGRAARSDRVDTRRVADVSAASDTVGP
jgi:hypothetical protein